MAGAKPAVVLVHGGFLGGWCWRDVADRLRDRGARVFTPTLTGLGERSHLLSPAVSLETHVADIVNLVAWEQLDDFVLCGHSYGGMVISAVAERLAPSIRALLYLDGYNPLPGGRVWDALSERARAAFEAGTDANYCIAPGLSGETVVRRENAARVDRLASPQPRRTLEDRIAFTSLRESIPIKHYVRARGYPAKMLDVCADYASATPGWTRRDLPFAHNLMIDEPEITADILAGLIWPAPASDHDTIPRTTARDLAESRS